MGVPLHQDLRAWLLRNNLDLPEEDVDDDLACCGFVGFPDEGSFFLGIRAIVGDITITGEYESLAHYFDSVAEMLTKIADGSYPVCEVADGRLVWS